MRKILLGGFLATALIGTILATFLYFGGMLSGNSLLNALQSGLRPQADTITGGDRIGDRLAGAFENPDEVLTATTEDLIADFLPGLDQPNEPKSDDGNPRPDDQNERIGASGGADKEIGDENASPDAEISETSIVDDMALPADGEVSDGKDSSTPIVPISDIAVLPDAPSDASNSNELMFEDVGTDRSQPTQPTGDASSNFNTTNIDGSGFPDNKTPENQLPSEPEQASVDWKTELLRAHEQEMLKMQLEHERRITADRFERSYQADKSPFGESNYQVAELLEAARGTLSAHEPRLETAGSLQQPQALEHINRSEPGATLSAGSLIPAVLTSEIRSELPGTVRALVTRDVFDRNYTRVLIPQGSILLGTYDNNTNQSQQRLFVAMERVELPDGTVVDLGEAPAVDQAGGAGLSGKRNSNFLTAIFQGTLLNLASNAARGGVAQNPSDLESAARIATGQAIGSVAERHMESVISQGVRFTIPAGTRFNVQVTKDYQFSSQMVSDPSETQFARAAPAKNVIVKQERQGQLPTRHLISVAIMKIGQRTTHVQTFAMHS